MPNPNPNKSRLWSLLLCTNSQLLDVIDGKANLADLDLVDLAFTLDMYTALVACIRRVAYIRKQSEGQLLVQALTALNGILTAVDGSRSEMAAALVLGALRTISFSVCNVQPWDSHTWALLVV